MEWKSSNWIRGEGLNSISVFQMLKHNSDVAAECHLQAQSLITWLSLPFARSHKSDVGDARAKSVVTNLGKIPRPDVALYSCHVILTDSPGNLSLSPIQPSSALELWVSNWWQRWTQYVCVGGCVESRRLWKGHRHYF